MNLNWKIALDRAQLQLKKNAPLIAIGVGALVLAPTVLPVIVKASKPFVKSAIKGSLAFYENGKSTVAETVEVLGDIIAEAQVELKTDKSQPPTEKTPESSNSDT